MAAERAKAAAEEAEKAAAKAKAEAEAKLAEAQKAMQAAEAAREARAERAKAQAKTSAFFKNTLATSENTVAPGISALASAEGYDKMLDSKKEKVSEIKESTKVSEIKSNPLMSFKSGSSSGVGASASTNISGPSISKERAKATSNSNQLGSILAGKTYNNSGRAPVWASPAMANVSAFKESEEAKEAREREEQKRIEEIEAKKAAEEKAKAAYTSIADSATSHKSAFFKRAQTGRDSASEQDGHVSAYGGIVRPSAIVDEEHEANKRMTAPAMGAALEGQRPSIMDPNAKAAPTASRPMAGFKGLGGDYEGQSDEDTQDIS